MIKFYTMIKRYFYIYGIFSKCCIRAIGCWGGVEVTGYEYEKKCARLLEAKGFSNVIVTPGSGDQGIDVLANKGKERYGVQCKYYEGPVGNKAVQEAYAGAGYYNCDVALVITNSTLTRSAKELAKKLNVAIWENIDLIYLRKHDAEYIKQVQEREKREKAKEHKEASKRKRQEFKEFSLWKNAYLSAIKAREERIQRGRQDLELSYEKQSSAAIELYGKEKEELEIQINDLNCERKMHVAKMSDLGAVQFFLKKQEKQNIKEIDTELTSIASRKLKLEQACKEKLKELQFSFDEELSQLSRRTEEEILLPEVPPVVQKIKSRFVDKNIQTEGKTKQQIENEKTKSRITLELYRQNQELTCTDIYEAIPEISHYGIVKVLSFVRELYIEGKICGIERKGKSYFYLSEQARRAYSFDDIFSFLVQCDKREIEALLLHTTEQKVN